MRLQDTRAMSEKKNNIKQEKEKIFPKKQRRLHEKHNVNTFTINGEVGFSNVPRHMCQR
jgi:hypothetical protein